MYPYSIRPYHLQTSGRGSTRLEERQAGRVVVGSRKLTVAEGRTRAVSQCCLVRRNLGGRGTQGGRRLCTRALGRKPRHLTSKAAMRRALCAELEKEKKANAADRPCPAAGGGGARRTRQERPRNPYSLGQAAKGPGNHRPTDCRWSLAQPVRSSRHKRYDRTGARARAEFVKVGAEDDTRHRCKYDYKHGAFSAVVIASVMNVRLSRADRRPWCWWWPEIRVVDVMWCQVGDVGGMW